MLARCILRRRAVTGGLRASSLLPLPLHRAWLAAPCLARTDGHRGFARICPGLTRLQHAKARAAPVHHRPGTCNSSMLPCLGGPGGRRAWGSGGGRASAGSPAKHEPNACQGIARLGTSIALHSAPAFRGRFFGPQPSVSPRAGHPIRPGTASWFIHPGETYRSETPTEAKPANIRVTFEIVGLPEFGGPAENGLADGPVGVSLGGGRGGGSARLLMAGLGVRSV